MRVAVVGNVASLGYLIGKELSSRGFDVDHYCTYNIFCSMPNANVIEMGKVYNLPFERTMRRAVHGFLKAYDVEIRLSQKKYVRSKNSIIIYNGDELRQGLVRPESKCFVTTKDLFPYVNGCDARLLPRCIDTNKFSRSNSKRIKKWKEGDELLIGHFPTDIRTKGSELVWKALGILRSMGCKSNIISKRVPRDEIVDYLSDVHVLCDQFSTGCYGAIAIEALVLGTPVVCHVKEEYFDFLDMKDLIVNCQPEPESIAKAIIDGAKMNVDAKAAIEFYSPSRSVDVLLGALKEWKMV